MLDTNGFVKEGLGLSKSFVDTNKAKDYRTEITLHQLFEEQVEKSPDQIALVFENKSMNYHELNEKANRLAHYLRQKGVGLETLVAIVCDRSFEMIIGILGVLKAGGAYVPMDPGNPQERLLYMLEDTNAPVLLTQSWLKNRLPETPAINVYLDQLAEICSEESTENSPLSSSNNLAYVIYTSGSTGKPKGVMNEHRGVINYLVSRQSKFQLYSDDKFILKTPFIFDVSVWEIFLPLTMGATLVILEPIKHKDTHYLCEFIIRHNITIIHFVPSVLDVILSEPTFSQCKSLRHVYCSGEALLSKQVDRFYKILDAELINLYGPTEASIDVTYWRAQPNCMIIPIGKPLDNIQIYILDSGLKPVPIGNIGELYIGGEGLARGYLNRPELTAEKFIIDPFSNQNSRLYQTGDRCRYLEDGNIEYLGRLDLQVKIRGIRIELGEIEYALEKYPEIKRAVVLVRNENLIAYCQLNDEEIVSKKIDKADEADIVNSWNLVYQDIYRNLNTNLNNFDTTGWVSSFDQRPIPEEEMHEWTNATLSRILSYQPSEILEIGCGSGLLLYPLVSHCKNYVGVDFSKGMIEKHNNNFKKLKIKNAAAFLGNADEVNQIGSLNPERKFDMIIVNSVIQHFPTKEYLDRVLSQCIDRINEGIIFLGDIRDYRLLSVFQLAILLGKNEAINSQNLRDLIKKRTLNEEELLVSPEYFLQIMQRNKKIKHIEILPKKGLSNNEMNRFRYDVILHVSETPKEIIECNWMKWTNTKDLSCLLKENQDLLAISHYPNKRIWIDYHLLEGIQVEVDNILGYEELYNLAKRHGYQLYVHLNLSGPRSAAFYDLIFYRNYVIKPNFAIIHQEVYNNKLTNCPLDAIKRRRYNFYPLRKFLAKSLPDHLIPTIFVKLDEMPITTNGKLDRKAIAALEPLNVSEFSPPRNPVEQALVEIWHEVLHLEQIGIHDNFFELGGNSLLVLQVVLRVERILNLKLELHDIFENPTVIGLSHYLEHAEKMSHTPIVPYARPEKIPLSFAQQRLWFLDQLKPESALYNAPIAFSLKGQIDIDALQRAFRAMIQRHEILRTTFKKQKGVAYQDIAKNIEFNLDYIQKYDHLETLIKEFSQKPFDLNHGPLFRAQLIKVDQNEYILEINLHHTITDGWSIAILVEELATLYNNVDSLPALPIQYADFTLWQRDYLREDGETAQSQLRYWQQQLQDAPGLLALSLDYQRPAVQSYRGDKISFQIPKIILEQLKGLSHAQGTTLFMTLLSIFYVLLYRYSGQNDIVVGTPVANRQREELELLMGFFVNTLALRVHISDKMTFNDLLALVKDVTLQGYVNQDIPFEKLLESIPVERTLAYSPLIQVMFILQNNQKPALNLSDIQATPVDIDVNFAKFDLTLSLTETTTGLDGEIEYATDLFKVTTINRLLGHFTKLLEEIVANPGQLIQQYELLTAAEKQQILIDWNNTTSFYPNDKTIHQLFEEQVEKSPDNIAIISENHKMTYRELNSKANQFAHYLKRQGLKLEDPVPIYFERSLQMIVAILGILKAGGAYVPIDPVIPQERQEYMLKDARAIKINFNKLDAVIVNESTENLNHISCQNNLAYIMYTSGSTGKPKAVMIEHRSVVNVIDYFGIVLKVNQASKWLSVTSLSFDIFGLELYMPLLFGAEIILPNKADSQNPNKLIELIKRHNVSHMQATPSKWQMLQNITWKGRKQLTGLCGGEALPISLQNYFNSIEGRFYNVFGPTETTIWSTIWMIDKNPIRIGHPIANTQVYVLDKCLNPVPVGVVGELYIGGDGLARGYLNHPDLTTERFIDLTIEDQQHRIYRTGDLCRYHEDGNLEFMGRIDFQVKIRGFRIELGEIETVLLSHPKIKQAVVLAREDEPDSKYLVAYYVTDQAAQLEANTVRDFVMNQLPEPMVPSYFIKLDAMPLTSNGKLDRKSLPAPKGAEIRHEYSPPQTPTEVVLAQIWEEVLCLEKVGIDDNFFELGGHSLLAIELFAKIQQEMGSHLPIADLFVAPTIAKLAIRINNEFGDSDHCLVALNHAGPKANLFCIHPIGGQVFCYMHLAQEFEGEFRCYGLQSQGLLPNHKAQLTIPEMAASYIQEIKTVQPQGPYRLVAWSFGGVIAIEMAHQFRIQGDSIENIILIDSFVTQDARKLIGHKVASNGITKQDEVQRANALSLKNYQAPQIKENLQLIYAAESVSNQQSSWGKLTTGKIEICTLKGDHYSLLKPENIKELCTRIRNNVNIHR